MEMITADVHGRTAWATRGDFNKSIQEAWDDGIDVEVEDYSYERARLDPESNAILLVQGGKVHTVIKAYDTVEYRFKIPVICVECGKHHKSPEECPNCGSDRWMVGE